MNVFLVLSFFLSVACADGVARLEVPIEETIPYMKEFFSTSPVLNDSDFTNYLKRAVKCGNREYLDLVLPKVSEFHFATSRTYHPPIPINFESEEAR